MYRPAQPMHMSTLSGTTQMVTPLAESTPVTQSLQIPMIHDRMPPVRDILQPISNKQAWADYLERQLKHMGSISRLPSDVPPPVETTHRPEKQCREATSEERYSRNEGQIQTGVITHDSLQKRVQDYCWENRVRRKQEWESHRMALDRMKEYKEQQRQQQSQEEQDVVYAQMLQEFKQT